MSASVTQSLESLQEAAGSIDASSAVALVRGVIKDPSANSTLTIVILSVAVLLVLLVLVLVVMLATPSTRKVVKVRKYKVRPAQDGESLQAPPGPRVVTKAPPPRKPPSRLFLALTGPVALTVLVVGALVGTYVLTSTNDYCAATCHASARSIKQAAKIHHATCVSCHGAPGLFGPTADTMSRLRMAVRAATGSNAAIVSVAVDPQACVRCHYDISGRVLVAKDGTRMSHKEVMAAGIPCTSCHDHTGHVKGSFTGSMSDCVTCHDSRIASERCTVCHAKDPAVAKALAATDMKAMGQSGMSFPAVRAAKRDCGGCHDQEKQCDTCHGLRMPHSQEFIHGGHARPSAFQNKTKCWKCHDPAFCTKGCHGGAFDPKGKWPAGHLITWEQDHKTASWDAGCVCHSQRHGTIRGRKPICVLCHDEKTHELLPIKQ